MQGHAACQLTDLEAGHFRQFLQRPQLRAGHAALPLDPLRMTLGGADQYPEIVCKTERGVTLPGLD